MKSPRRNTHYAHRKREREKYEENNSGVQLGCRGRHIIPEEKKPALEVHDNYEAQLGAYFVLIEEHYEKRPPYGFLVLGTGRRHKIKNTEDLRNRVIGTAQAIRTARTNLRKPLAGADNPKKGEGCEESRSCTVKPAGV